MDSEHRHELKESDLVHALGSAKQWWGKHQTKVLLAAIALALVILGVRWMKGKSYNAHEKLWWELNTETGAAGLKVIAQSTGDAGAKSLATLRAADLLLTQAVTPPSPGEQGLSDADRAKALDEAEALCQSLARDAKHAGFVVNAKLRLATIAEQRGQWDKARDLYQAIQKEAGAGYEYLAERAAGLEKALAKIQTPPVFGPEPKPIDPTKFDPTKFDPTKFDPTKFDPTKIDPTKTDPTKTDPTKVDPTKVDPAKTDPTKVDPTKVDPAKVDPSKTDPTKVDPAKVDPAKTDPSKTTPEKDAKAPTP